MRDNLGDKLDPHNIAQNAARAATIDKDSAVDDSVAEIRKIRDLIKANFVADPKYAALGIPAAAANVRATATVPVATVDTSERMRHTINFTGALVTVQL